jgi:hypothetical protein
VLSLIQRLPDTSLTAALALGGREFFGWGQDRVMAADLYDAMSLNTRAAGRWAKKPPDIPEYPRPKSQQEEPKRATTVAELYKQLTASK